MRWNLDKSILCLKCGLKPAKYKKLILCGRCYYKHYGTFPDHSVKMPIRSMLAREKRIAKEIVRHRNLETKEINKTPIRGYRGQQNKSEILFAQSHQTYLFEPATFDLGDSTYTPDFYDAQENTFYKVIGSRQRFESLRDKIERFRKLFPEIKLQVVCANGEFYHSSKFPELVSGQQLVYQ